MKHRRGLGAAGVTAIVGAAVIALILLALASIRHESAEDRAALKEQYRLARAERLPPTWQEFAATIRPAKPSENAAPYFSKLSALKTTGDTKLGPLIRELALHPDPEERQAAQRPLQENRPALALLDRATSLPRCWFNRDWSLGFAVLLGESAKMLVGADLLVLLGLVAAQADNTSDEIADFGQAEALALQIRQEGTTMSCLVGERNFALVAHAIDLLAYAHPEHGEYRPLLAKLAADWPKIDPKWMHREDLYELLQLIDWSLTEKGRKLLGLKPDDVGPVLRAFPSIGNKARAKTKIIEAERRIWESYADPPLMRRTKMEQAKRDLREAMTAFPIAFRVYFQFSGDDVDLSGDRLTVDRLQFIDIARALAHGRPPKSLDLSDLRSPYDGKPLGYSFNGRQIVITVSNPGGDFSVEPLKLPSDEDLGHKGPD